MSFHGPPVAFALFVWWFSTGLIIVLDNLPARTFRWSMLGMTAVSGCALYWLWGVSDDASVSGAYTAFACGLLVWGWQEMSFLMGYVTGPRRTACAQGCNFWSHFGHGVQAVLYHELAIIAGAAAVVAVSWGAPNQVGVWTYMILWGMRVSAKLNLFLGVRNLNESFLPVHLRYLGSFFRIRPMNLLFPFSVTGGMILSIVLVQRAAAEISEFNAVALTFAATMTILGLVEHWAMILPVPFAALWNWSPRTWSAGPAEPALLVEHEACAHDHAATAHGAAAAPATAAGRLRRLRYS
jgi:putative photosynthetic complex assembly protein 2